MPPNAVNFERFYMLEVIEIKENIASLPMLILSEQQSKEASNERLIHRERNFYVNLSALGPAWPGGRWTAFAVDGSRLEVPRTVRNERVLGCAGKKRTGPLLSLTVLYHLGTGLAWNWRIGKGTESERRHLRSMLAELPTEALWVAEEQTESTAADASIDPTEQAVRGRNYFGR